MVTAQPVTRVNSAVRDYPVVLNIDRACAPQVSSLKSQVVSLQTAHSWANAGVLLGDACIGSGVAFEAI